MWLDKILSKLEFEDEGNKEYKVKAIWNYTVHARESKSNLPDLYYLVI